MISNNFEPITSWCFTHETAPKWAYWDGAFTTEECQQIIDIGNNKGLCKGVIDDGDYDISHRDCDIQWLYPNDIDWVFRRITDIVLDLNSRFFKFDLFGMVEGFQFGKYSAPSGKHVAHLDPGLGKPIRKLSVVIQLSPETDYDGGNLELFLGGDPSSMDRKQGHVIVFPSYTLHGVSPITRGTRYSLVSWVTGVPFK
jgi:PKHD-type hydroxylase